MFLSWPHIYHFTLQRFLGLDASALLPAAPGAENWLNSCVYLCWFFFPAASISTMAKWKFKSLWWLATNIAFCNGFGVPSKQRTILQCTADSTTVYLTDVLVQSAFHYWTKHNLCYSWEKRVTWDRKQRFPYLAHRISSPADIDYRGAGYWMRSCLAWVWLEQVLYN